MYAINTMGMYLVNRISTIAKASDSVTKEIVNGVATDVLLTCRFCCLYCIMIGQTTSAKFLLFFHPTYFH